MSAEPSNKRVDNRVLAAEETESGQNQATDTFEDQEDKYRRLFELVSDGLFLIDSTNGRILETNRAATEMYGYAREELLKLRNVDLSAEPKSTARAAQGKMSVVPVRYHRKKDGTIFPVEITGSHFEWQGRKVHIAAIRDISRRLKTEEALRESEAQHRTILQTAMDGFVQVDSQGRIVEVNAAYCLMTGYSEKELLTMRITDLEAMETPEQVAAHIEKIIDQGEDRFPTRHRCRDGTVIDVEVCVQYRVGDGGRMVCFIRDITERKNLELRIQQAQKMESIGNLAGGIAHDFNNLLSPIIGMTELLLEDLPPGSIQYENAKEIIRAGKRGGELVTQILAFSRQTEQKMIPVRVQQILREVLKLSRSTIPSNIEIVQDLQENCGLVLADPTQLHQVSMNLLTNAYHAVEPTAGKIFVLLKETFIESDKPAAGGLEKGRYVVLTVSDTGCGMEPSVIDKIFEPYFTTKDQGKGTGLGLAMVYGIVKDHNGDIQVHSEIGKQTTFNVYLPVMEQSTEKVSGETAEGYTAGNEQILLVDDEMPIVRLQSQILNRLGYGVTARTSSVEALEAFKANPSAFDLVLTDMTMPNMTGDQLAIELISIRPDIPVIIFTGFSSRLSPEKAKEIGIKGLLMKPIVKSEMARIVRKILDEAKSSPQ